MIRQIVLNCIANNDIKIVRYTCPQYLQDPINKFLYLYSGRELLLRNACMLLNGQCEKSRVPPKNELTTAVTKSNHPDPNQLSLAMSTTRQLQEAVAQRWIAIVSLLGIQMEFFISDIMQQCFIQYVLH